MNNTKPPAQPASAKGPAAPAKDPAAATKQATEPGKGAQTKDTDDTSKKVDQPPAEGDQPLAEGESSNKAANDPPADDKPEPPPPPAVCPNGSSDIIATIFNFIYLIMAVVAILLILILFILSLMDYLNTKISDFVQYVSRFINPNMYNKDTIDFKVLGYSRNSVETEPYTIFTQQEIVKTMFNLGISFITAIFIQVLILVVLLIVYKVFKNEPLTIGKIEFGKNVTAYGTIILMIILAFSVSALYKGTFLNKVQPGIITTYSNIEQVKNYIYDNLTTNENFMISLVNGDLSECIKIINQQTNDSRISRMIYTMSLYNFFKINVSENEEEFNTIIKSIFTTAQIRVRDINPLHYMYYNQNVFLPNLYPLLRQYIYGTDATKVIRSATRDKIIRLDITRRINETNKRLMTLYKVPERKTKLDRYLLVNLLIVFIFTVIVYGLHREKIKQIFGGMFKPIKEILLLLIFTGKKKEESEASDKNNKSPVPEKAEASGNSNKPPIPTQEKPAPTGKQTPATPLPTQGTPDLKDIVKQINTPENIQTVKEAISTIPKNIQNIATGVINRVTRNKLPRPASAPSTNSTQIKSSPP